MVHGRRTCIAAWWTRCPVGPKIGRDAPGGRTYSSPVRQELHQIQGAAAPIAVE